MAKNFRKTYYKTLGVPVVQEVDVQTSFCTLLSENVIDINQLIRVTLKYGCPAMYRKVVWEIVLGVLPNQKEAWSFVQEQRIATYQDIKSTSIVLAQPTTETQDAIVRLYLVYHDAILGLPPYQDTHNVHELVQLTQLIQLVGDEEWEQFWVLVGSLEVLQHQALPAASSLAEFEQSLFRIIAASYRHPHQQQHHHHPHHPPH